MRHARSIALAAALSAAGSATAQSTNIDFNNQRGVPTAGYAAAGLPGVWNALLGPEGVAESLVGLDGLSITATITQTGAAAIDGFDHPMMDGEVAALLEDRLLSFFPTINLDFEGLDNGLYQVFTYAFSRSPRDARVTINDDPATAFDYITGWTGALELGVNYAMHIADVVDGSLRISIDFPGDDPVVQGVQLVLVPGPGAAALLLVGGYFSAVGKRRRRITTCRAPGTLSGC